MAKILIGISILLMTLALVFGYLNTNKVKGLREELVTTKSARDVADRGRATSEKKLKAEDKEISDAKSKATDADAKLQSAQADLSKAQTAQAEAEAKVQAGETQIADLQKRVADATAGAGAGGDVAPNDATAALADTKKQLDAAEQEKTVLADKVKAAQDQVANLEEDKKRRESGNSAPGVHGTVLAVNQAYNFVVLGIGDRQGVVPNSEMLVMRGGSLIGKIRISSVEPTTCIGDIVTSSLAHGVQVLPGDTVVYAGSTNS